MRPSLAKQVLWEHHCCAEKRRGKNKGNEDVKKLSWMLVMEGNSICLQIQDMLCSWRGSRESWHTGLAKQVCAAAARQREREGGGGQPSQAAEASAATLTLIQLSSLALPCWTTPCTLDYISIAHFEKCCPLGCRVASKQHKSLYNPVLPHTLTCA